MQLVLLLAWQVRGMLLQVHSIRQKKNNTPFGIGSFPIAALGRMSLISGMP